MQRFAILPLLFACACVGSITGGDSDPPTQDPPQNPPPPVTDVKLTVHDGATPVAGVKVLFQAADDSLIADATTDATGTATAKMPAGGNVTAIRSFVPGINGEPAPIDQVTTYVGVKPGDVIDLAGASRDTTPYLATITVAFDQGQIIGVMTPCGSGYGSAPAIQVELHGCGGETDFYVVNYSGDTDDDGNNSGPLYLLKHAQLAPTIDFSAETFRGTLSTETTAANPMADAQVSLQKRLVTGTFTVFDTGAVPTTTLAADVPELPSAEQIVTAYVSYAGRTQLISSRSAFSPAPATIDIAGGLIPASSSPGLAGNMLSWSQDGTGTADFSIASLVVSAQDRTFVRAIAAPYTGTSLRIPSLPATFDKYNVQATDTPRIAHQLAAVTGGWDAARAHVFSGVDLAPMGGTARVSYAASAGDPNR